MRGKGEQGGEGLPTHPPTKAATVVPCRFLAEPGFCTLSSVRTHEVDGERDDRSPRELFAVSSCRRVVGSYNSLLRVRWGLFRSRLSPHMYVPRYTAEETRTRWRAGTKAQPGQMAPQIPRRYHKSINGWSVVVPQASGSTRKRGAISPCPTRGNLALRDTADALGVVMLRPPDWQRLFSVSQHAIEAPPYSVRIHTPPGVAAPCLIFCFFGGGI